MATRRKAATPAQKPEHLFFNRDESWLKFNGRVLEEAQDPTNPLLERLRFLSITASNLDEFTEVRVASILQRIEDGFASPEDDDGLSERERMDRLADSLHSYSHEQYNCWVRQLQPALAAERIHLLSWKGLTHDERDFAQSFYQQEVDPLLTPVTIDPTHPFPRVLNKALCLALLLRRKRGNVQVLGVVNIPRSLQRWILLPAPAGDVRVLALQELVEAHAERLFPATPSSVAHLSASPATAISTSRKKSRAPSSNQSARSSTTAAKVTSSASKSKPAPTKACSSSYASTSTSTAGKSSAPTARSTSPASPTSTASSTAPDLKFTKFTGREVCLDKALDGKPQSIFQTLRERDVLLHHPFDSYTAVEKFMEAAAHDPEVVSIKQTLYRTSPNSPLFHALLDAAPTTDVTVVVELMARFDEDSNIRWARTLEDAGVQVFHGIVGKKTHAKLALLVRRDGDGITRRYAHLGTGQLQLRHRPLLHRHQPAHQQSHHHQRSPESVQLSHRPGRADRLRAAPRRAHHPRSRHPRPHRP